MNTQPGSPNPPQVPSQSSPVSPSQDASQAQYPPQSQPQDPSQYPPQPQYPPQYPPQSQPPYPPQPSVPQYPPSPYPPQYPYPPQPTMPPYPAQPYPPQSQTQYPPQYPPPYPGQAPQYYPTPTQPPQFLPPLPAPPQSFPAQPPQGQPFPAQPGPFQPAPSPSPVATLQRPPTKRSFGVTLALWATGLTILAAAMVAAALAYRFSHSNIASSQLPKWVTVLPPAASALSFLALGLHFVAKRITRNERKRLEALYTAAGAAAATSDLPTWLGWARPGCAQVAQASAQVVTVAVLVASVGTTVAGSRIGSQLATTPKATATATVTPTATATATPTGPHGQQTFAITNPSLRQANYITVAPDGSLWWSGQGAFGRLDASGAMTSIPYPSAWSTNRFGETMLAGPDGNIWFTEYTTGSTPASADHIGKITPSGTLTEYAITHANNGPSAMVAGPDGNIWFTEGGNTNSSKQPLQDGVIGRVTLSGVVTEYKIPVSSAHPQGLTKGPDNNLWFTAFISSAPDATGKTTNVADYVGRITPAGAITLYKVSGQAQAIGDIITGPDGALWFGLGNYQRTASSQPGSIGRISAQGQFLAPISLASLNDPTAEYGLPSNFVVTNNGDVYFGNFEYQTSVTSGTVIYGPLIYDVTSGGQAATLAAVSNLECYAVSAGPNGSVTCAEDSDIQTLLP